MKKLFILLVSFVTFYSFNSVTVQALSPGDIKAITEETTMYDPDSNSCGDTASANISNSTSKKTVFIGDSLTVNMARADLLGKASAAGLEVNTAYQETADTLSDGSATTRVHGDSIEATNGINVSATRPKIAAIPGITSAGIVVIGLGTNREEEFGPQIESLIDEIRRVNTTNPNIYWTNTYFTAQSSVSHTARNDIIRASSTRKNFRIIDFAAEAQANPDTYPLNADDGTHHTGVGDTNKADFIIRSIGGTTTPASPAAAAAPAATATPAPTASASYDPISLTYPAFPDENAVASAFTAYMVENKPNSPWMSVSSDIGSWIFAESKTRNINPLIIIAGGKQENGFGTTDNDHVVNGHNYFGIGAPNYRRFESPAAGLLGFMDDVQENITGGDPNYVNVTNFYEFFAMHQSGVVQYPGDPLDPNDVTGPDLANIMSRRRVPDGDTMNGWDPAMRVYTSWDESKNDQGFPVNPEYRGQTYNPGIYYKNSIAFINRLTGLQLSDVPAKGGTVLASCNGSSSGEKFNGTAPGKETQVIDGFVVYKQYDETWSEEFYGEGINANGEQRTIRSSGCGPTAMAMIITTLTGQIVTPSQTAAFGMRPESKTTSSEGGSNGVPLAERMAANWGLRATHIGANRQLIEDTIRGGGYVIVSGQGELPFSEGGHFVVIRAITPDGKWLVGDSSHRDSGSDTTPFDPQTMINDFTGGGYSAYAITK